jgi:hypothetical protein
MRYWLSTGDGKTYGPYTLEELGQFVAEGRVHEQCHLCLEGSSQWVPAGSVVSLAAPAPPSFTGFPSAPPPAHDGQALFLNISVGRLIGMMLASGGIYAAYWIYRNWRFVKERTGEGMWPFWRGIFGIFWIHPLLVKVRDASVGHERQVGTLSPGALSAGFIVCVILSAIMGRSNQPAVFLVSLLLGYVGYSMLIPAQVLVNRLHTVVAPTAPPYPFSAGHVVCVCIGALGWIGVILTLAGAAN